MLLSTFLYSHIARKKLRIAWFYDSRLSHNLQSYHGEGRATITRYNFLPAYANPWLKSQNRKAPPPKLLHLSASLFPPSHPLNEAEGAIDTRALQRTPKSSRQIPLQTRSILRATSCMPRSCLQADTRHITQRDRKEGSRTFEGQLRMLSAACLVVVASVLQGRRPTDRRPRQVCPFARSSVSQLVPPSMDNGNGPFTHMLCSCSPRDDALVNCSHLAFIEIN